MWSPVQSRLKPRQDQYNSFTNLSRAPTVIRGKCKLSEAVDQSLSLSLSQSDLDQGYNGAARVPEWPQKRPPLSAPAKTSQSFVSFLSPLTGCSEGRAALCRTLQTCSFTRNRKVEEWRTVLLTSLVLTIFMDQCNVNSIFTMIYML